MVVDSTCLWTSFRYKVHEEKLFIEKEDLRSQLEALQEEKAKLIKVQLSVYLLVRIL